MASITDQPIVILGGFLGRPPLYQEMQKSLNSITGQPVRVVETSLIDWMLCVSASGWAKVLDRLDRQVKFTLGEHSAERVILIGHSSGGVMGRLYLSKDFFKGRRYSGLEKVSHLITLGSPHYNPPQARLRYWVEKQYPGGYFIPQVEYVSVAGVLKDQKNNHPISGLLSNAFYRSLAGEGIHKGDGFVPVKSAILEGSHPIILEGVSHTRLFGKLWYGSASVVKTWWEKTLEVF